MCGGRINNLVEKKCVFFFNVKRCYQDVICQFAIVCVASWCVSLGIFWSRLTFDIIWYVNCVRATAFIFDTRTGGLVKVSKILRQKMSRPEGDLYPTTFGFMPNALTYWAIRARHFCPMFFGHWLWWYRYFWSKVKTFDLFTVHGQQHSFSTHEWVSLWKCQSFWDRKYLDLTGTRTLNLRIHAECSNLLSYQGQTFAVPCF